jgi:GLPGLI family protein
MKKILAVVMFASASHYSAIAQEAKIISDCTVHFDVSVEDPKANPQVIKSMTGASKVVYIKGAESRSDLITPGFKQTTLTNEKSDTTVVLRELGSVKYVSYLNGSKRQIQNKKYEGIQFNNTSEKKTILGYDCKKVVAKLADGSTYNVFYASSIAPSSKEFEYQFRNLPGFVLEYESESEDGKTKIKYTATKITLEPVPVALFDLPKSGYRVL